jgi:hypothetical protein
MCFTVPVLHGRLLLAYHRDYGSSVEISTEEISLMKIVNGPVKITAMAMVIQLFFVVQCLGKNCGEAV